MRARHYLLILSLALVPASCVIAGPASAREPEIFTGLVQGVAIGGYDPVAYFTEGKPVQGRPELALVHAGVEWRFASALNRLAFQADPQRYMPKYGGYCAFAVAHGATAPGNPQNWKIVDGRLYLNFSDGVQKAWEADMADEIRNADSNWPRVLGE